MGIKGFDAWLTREPDNEYPCDICGKMPDDCICPECPVCLTYGDPDCYLDGEKARRNNHPQHGLTRNEEQKVSYAEYQKYVKEETERVNKFFR